MTVRWSVRRGQDRTRRCLDRRERGGPPASPPSRTGFGSQTIRMMVEGGVSGQVERTFEADALACRIQRPWREPTEA